MNKSDYEVLIAIDIGLTGAISFFDVQSGEVLAVHEMPTKPSVTSKGKNKNILDLDKLKFLLEIPKEHNDRTLVVYENVHAYPGQGVVSVGTLLWQRGVLQGMVKALGYNELAIQPQVWQKHFGMVPHKDLKGVTAKKTKTLRKAWLKEKSLEIARAKFPEWEGKMEKSTAHGISDSLLIGKFILETN